MSLARSVFRHLKWLLTFFQPATVSSCLSISTILEVFTGNALLLALGRPSITGRHGLLSVASPRRLPIDFKREREREREWVAMALLWERKRLSAGKNAEEKWMCPRALPLTTWPRRAGRTCVASRISSRRFAIDFELIDPRNRSTTRILSNTSSTG